MDGHLSSSYFVAIKLDFGPWTAIRRIPSPHPVEGAISSFLGGPLDVFTVVVPALRAAAEAVLLARENAQQRASVRYSQPQLLVRVWQWRVAGLLLGEGEGVRE